MKWLRTTLITTLFFWLAQFILIGLFLTVWVVNALLKLCACFGAVLPETAIQDFITNLLKFLFFPVKHLFKESVIGDSSASFWVMGVDSLAWGVGIAMLIYLAGRWRRRNRNPET